MTKITYAKVYGPPDDWFGLHIRDLDAGAEIKDVIEVNAAEGWLIRLQRGEDGLLLSNGDGVATERLTGSFEIFRPC